MPPLQSRSNSSLIDCCPAEPAPGPRRGTSLTQGGWWTLCHSCARACRPGPFGSRAKDASRFPRAPDGRACPVSSQSFTASGPPSTDAGIPTVISGPALPQFDEPYDPLKAPPDPQEQILSQQTVALNALVSHLVQGGGDSFGIDYHGGGTASSSTRGTQRREKLQQDLASRQSTFFLALQQQIYRRLHPSTVIPRTEEEVQKNAPSLLTYLERYGGFKGQKEAGLTMWIFAHALDSAAAGDFYATKEYLALGDGIGTECFRCRRLGACLRFVPHRGPTSSALSRPNAVNHFCWPALCSADPSYIGHYQFGLSEGDRRATNPKAGNKGKEGSSCKPQERGRVAQSKAQAQIPQEAERARGVSAMSDVTSSVEFNSVPKAGDVAGLPKVQSCPPDALNESEHSNVRHISFPMWCSKLITLVLRTRTAFASFLAFSISTARRLTLRTPSPSLVCFDRMPAKNSSSRRRAIGLLRAVHVICMALNFWHSGGSFVDESALQRGPGAPHRALYRRIRAFIKSDGLIATFDALHVGRKNPELFARLIEVTELLTKLGCSASPYSKVFAGCNVPQDNSRYPELEPYRDLDPSRIVLHGRGHWDVTEFLGDSLVMAYREPESVKLERTPASWEYPRIRDDAGTVAELAHLWDRQGLLLLHQDRVATRQSFELVRVFNCYKAIDKDRQIGDRRGRNAIEGVLRGPSSNLPAGQDLCDLVVDLRCQRIHASVSDRRVFYHQIWVTRARAVSNTLGPGLPVSLVEDTAAYQHFLFNNAKTKYSRARHGDRLAMSSGVSSKGDLLWASFQSILQGDHGGVEIATDAHSRLLKSYGLLSEGVQLVANRPCVSATRCEGLVIDDFFSISIDDHDIPSPSSQSYKSYQTAQQAYEDYKLLGSPEKDVRAAHEGKVIGAYINNGGPEAVKNGVCTIGAPAGKRLSLSFLTLQVRSLAYTTTSLHRCIVGACSFIGGL